MSASDPYFRNLRSLRLLLLGAPVCLIRRNAGKLGVIQQRVDETCLHVPWRLVRIIRGTAEDSD